MEIHPLKSFLKSFLPEKLKKKVTIIPVVKMSGAIAAGSSPLKSTLALSSVAGQLEKAFSFKKSPAVAIVVNSPGGSPVQSRLIYQRIRDLAEENEKKVHVFVEDAAASGGYMIACAGDDITADPSSIVGSIGVIFSGFGLVGAIDKLGIERRLHTAGDNKSVLDPFLPEKAEDIERLKKIQLEIHDVFIKLVRQSRGDRLSDDPDLFTGAFWTGEQGLERGLVDAIGDVRGRLKSLYGKETKLKLIEPKRGLFGRGGLLGSRLSPATEIMAAQMVDGAIQAVEERSRWSRFGL